MVCPSLSCRNALHYRRFSDTFLFRIGGRSPSLVRGPRRVHVDSDGSKQAAHLVVEFATDGGDLRIFQAGEERAGLIEADHGVAAIVTMDEDAQGA